MKLSGLIIPVLAFVWLLFHACEEKKSEKMLEFFFNIPLETYTTIILEEDYNQYTVTKESENYDLAKSELEKFLKSLKKGAPMREKTGNIHLFTLFLISDTHSFELILDYQTDINKILIVASDGNMRITESFFIDYNDIIQFISHFKKSGEYAKIQREEIK